MCRGNDLTDVCRGTVGAKHTSQLAARDDTFQCGETHQYLIDLVATERSMLRETDFQVMVDNRWKMYRRMGSCQSTAFNDNFVPMGDRFEGREYVLYDNRLTSHKVAIKVATWQSSALALQTPSKFEAASPMGLGQSGQIGQTVLTGLAMK